MRKMAEKSSADKMTPLESARKKYHKKLMETEKLKNTDVLGGKSNSEAPVVAKKKPFWKKPIEGKSKW